MSANKIKKDRKNMKRLWSEYAKEEIRKYIRDYKRLKFWRRVRLAFDIIFRKESRII